MRASGFLARSCSSLFRVQQGRGCPYRRDVIPDALQRRGGQWCRPSPLVPRGSPGTQPALAGLLISAAALTIAKNDARTLSSVIVQ